MAQKTTELGPRDTPLNRDVFVTPRIPTVRSDRVAGTATNARELYDKMLELYPDRVNPGALWLWAPAVKP